MTASQSAFDFGPGPGGAQPGRSNLVIEAGAGTGKTTAIVGEVLELILSREELAPERIVLMTFTEKAAGEIADRIRGALEELSLRLETEPDDEGPLGWPKKSSSPLVTITDRAAAARSIARHLSRIDALRSQTIHSFCQSLLRGFPIEAGLDPQFKIIEGFERSLLYGRLYDQWLEHETRAGADADVVRELELLFTHAGYLFQIRELILALINRRDLLDEREYELGSYEEVRAPFEDALSAIRRSPDIAGDEHALRVFEHVRGAVPSVATMEEAIAWLQPIAASIREANLPRNGVLKEALKILRAGDKGRSLYDRLVSHRAALALLTLTRRFLAFLDEEKRRLGVVDFDDLLLRTLALLDDPAVLRRARLQFDFIFVDEFQDTDRTQARIIDRLARDEGGQFVPGRLVVVGDPKQSIYGFRRADPETYHQMTEELVRTGAKRRLISEQYRTDPELLEIMNAMFSRLFPPQPLHDPNVFRPPYNALRARGDAVQNDAPRMSVVQCFAGEERDRFEAEADAIAGRIASARDGSGHDLRRFAILFRRLTKLDVYLEALDRHGIEYVLPPTRMFLERRAAVDLLTVLRAIGYAFDSGAQISAARSPYFALTDVEIAAGGEEWTAFTSVMSRFRDAARHLTLSQLVELVIARCAIEGVYQAAADGEKHLSHLEHMRAIAFEYDHRTGGSVRQFVDEIARRRSEPEETEPSLMDDSQNAVRIMSVHAAKGLEFDTVILPDLSFPTGGNDLLSLFTVESPRSLVLSGRAESISANFRVTEDEQKLKKISGQREEAETRRLFYVAVTRAKAEVVFVCSLGDEVKWQGFLKCLTESLGVDRKGLVALFDGAELQQTAVGTLAFVNVSEAAAARIDGRVRPRLRDGRREEALATADIVPLELPEVEIEEAASPHRPSGRSRAAGILLHRVLELWDGGDFERPLRGAAAEAGAEAAVVAAVRKRLAGLDRSPMLRRIASAETIGRELPIRFVEEGTVVERRIDRLLRDGSGDLVVDYKSGPHEPDRVERDRRQVDRYAEAIRSITGRPCQAVLWYVDDDVVI